MISFIFAGLKWSGLVLRCVLNYKDAVALGLSRPVGLNCFGGPTSIFGRTWLVRNGPLGLWANAFYIDFLLTLSLDSRGDGDLRGEALGEGENLFSSSMFRLEKAARSRRFFIGLLRFVDMVIGEGSNGLKTISFLSLASAAF